MSEFKTKDVVVMNVPKGSFYDYGGLMEVAIGGGPRPFVGWHPIFKYGSVDKSVIRHATPEEVSLGHRIGTKQIEDIGDDFPIENHISPNCKAKDV